MMVIAAMRNFLESKFAFWFVTTILVGAATTANAFLQNHFAESQKRHSLSERLDLEVEYRLSQYIVGLARMSRYPEQPHTLRDGYTSDDVKALTQALIGIPKPVKDVLFFSMYPREFGDRPLAALLAEKASLHPDGAKTFKGQIASVSGDTLFEQRDFADVLKLASDVNRILFPGNASGEFFYYTDCPPDGPLC
jgi:hypothetical protein